MSQQRTKKFIVNASTVANRLAGLKNEAIRAAIAENKDSDITEAPFGWWRPALEFDWSGIHKGSNSTQWCNVIYTAQNGSSGKLAIRVLGELHCGQIMPKTDEGVAELAKLAKPNGDQVIKKRDKKACIQVQKWNVPVKTEEDGCTIIKDEQGNPKYPSDDKLSNYYRAASLLSEAFETDCRSRVERGQALAAFLADIKKKEKSISGPDAVAAFNAANGARMPYDVIFSAEHSAAIRKLYAAGADSIMKGTIVANSTKVVSLIQTLISNDAKKNAGKDLPNPMTRIAMNFGDDGVSKSEFYDKSKPFIMDGKTQYEAATVEENNILVPINDGNIHKFITPRSAIDGVINAEGICFSNMGISIPVSTHVIIVEQAVRTKAGQSDVYGDDDDGEDGEEKSSTTTPAATTTAATTAPAVATKTAATTTPPVATPPVATPASQQPIAAADEGAYDAALAALEDM